MIATIVAVGTIESNHPIVGQGAGFLLALARMEPDRPPIIAKQEDFKPTIGLAENA
jgi:hypothetical protein